MAESAASTDTITTEQIAILVESACRAPSLHNSQPWRWVFDRGTLHLFADHTRVGRHTDSTGREVILSCGAALDHLQVAAAAAGWPVSVERYPDRDNHDHLASAIFHPATPVDEHIRSLAEAIARRRTDRLAFAAPEPWPHLEQQLRVCLHGTTTQLDVVSDDERPILADASRRSEEHRRDDASYQYELLWWTGHSDSAAGVPSSALPSSSEAPHVDIARAFPTYGSGDRRPEVAHDHSKVIVLSTYDDSLENTLRCGEALSRVLLECTAAGLATCTLTHMIELHASREIVRRLTGRHAEPQVLIRIGRVPETNQQLERTHRRPVTDVLDVS